MFQMVTSSFDQALIDLLGEELYRDYSFISNCDSDHTPLDDQLSVSTHAFEIENGQATCNVDLDSIFLEASNQFEQSSTTSANESKPAIGQKFASPKS